MASVAAKRPVVALSRPSERLHESVALLESRGYEVVAAPLLESSAGDDGAFATFARELVANRVDVVVFTSPQGLAAASALADRAGLEEFLDLLRARHVAAIGPKTAESLVASGLRPGLVASEHTSRGLARDLGERVEGRRVALLRSAHGDPDLPRDLAALGAEVLDVPVYSLARPPTGEAQRALVRAVAEGRVEAFAFTSPLTVAHFFDLMEEQGVEREFRLALDRAVVVAIGPPTAAALSARGVGARLPREATFLSLVAAIDESVGRPEAGAPPR